MFDVPNSAMIEKSPAATLCRRRCVYFEGIRRNYAFASKNSRLAWIVTILVAGLIHLIDAPENMSDVAYKGIHFYANGIAAFVAAWGIFRNKSMWGWHLGALVAGLALIGYIASRTIGLPLLPPEPDAWLEPLGVLSLVAEAGFLTLYG